MARDDYWNRGGRREDLRSSSSLDTIERLLGIGKGIAQTVQSNRDRRKESNLSYVSTLISGIGKNFMNEGVGGVQNISDKLNTYIVNMGDKADADTLQMIDIAKMKVEQQLASNTDFNSQKDIMYKKQANYQEFISDMWFYDDPLNVNATAKKKEIREKYGEKYYQDKNKFSSEDDEVAWRIDYDEKMFGMMEDYSKDFSNWYTRHSDRLTDGMISNFNISGQYMREALNAYRDDGKIDETEHDFYYGGITTGRVEELSNFVNTRGAGDKLALESALGNMDEQKGNYRKAKNILIDKQISYKDALSILPDYLLPELKESGFLDGEGNIDESAKAYLSEAQHNYILDNYLEDTYAKAVDIDKRLIGLKQKSALDDDLWNDYRRTLEGGKGTEAAYDASLGYAPPPDKTKPKESYYDVVDSDGDGEGDGKLSRVVNNKDLLNVDYNTEGIVKGSAKEKNIIAITDRAVTLNQMITGEPYDPSKDAAHYKKIYNLDRPQAQAIANIHKKGRGRGGFDDSSKTTEATDKSAVDVSRLRLNQILNPSKAGGGDIASNAGNEVMNPEIGLDEAVELKAMHEEDYAKYNKTIESLKYYAENSAYEEDRIKARNILRQGGISGNWEFGEGDKTGLSLKPGVMTKLDGSPYEPYFSPYELYDDKENLEYGFHPDRFLTDENLMAEVGLDDIDKLGLELLSYRYKWRGAQFGKTDKQTWLGQESYSPMEVPWKDERGFGGVPETILKSAKEVLDINPLDMKEKDLKRLDEIFGNLIPNYPKSSRGVYHIQDAIPIASGHKDRKGNLSNNAYNQLRFMLEYYDLLESVLSEDLIKLEQNKKNN